MVEYRCAGNKAGKFDVKLFFTFTWPSEINRTSLVLRQEKVCASRDVRRAFGIILTFIYYNGTC